MVIGAFVRGLSMRDVESLCERPGSASCRSRPRRASAPSSGNASRVQAPRSLRRPLAALFVDAVFLSVRPEGPKEGVLVACNFTEDGERVLLQVMLGMRESYEDWLELGRDLIARGLGAPMLIVAEGARADQGDRAVPARLRPSALRGASRAQPARQAARPRARTRPPDLLAGARRRLQRARRQAATAGAGRRARRAGYTAAARCRAADLDALVVQLRYPTRDRADGEPPTCSSDRSARSSVGRR